MRSEQPTIDLTGKQHIANEEEGGNGVDASQNNNTKKQKKNAPAATVFPNYKISQFHKAEEGDCCYGFCPGDLGLFEWRDFSFFYESSMDRLEKAFAANSKKWKVFFWVALGVFYLSSFLIPVVSFSSCEEGFGQAGFYVFAAFALYITVLEAVVTAPLLETMREMQLEPEFRTLKWYFDLFLSFLMKADLLTDYSILVYGSRCYGYSEFVQNAKDL